MYMQHLWQLLSLLPPLLLMIMLLLLLFGYFFSAVAAALMFNSRYKLCDARVQQPFYFDDLHQTNGEKVRKAIFTACTLHIVCVHFFGRCRCCHALMKLLSFCLVTLTHINSMFYTIFDHHNFFIRPKPSHSIYTHSQLSHQNV